ncbi:MAG: hypothetical protein NW237_06755 [Cyanobacteriota bacterium]|nr:hypothetical protein [Cyanobacteriota bacterium]
MKPPRKKIPTGPTKADLLARLGSPALPAADPTPSPENVVPSLEDPSPPADACPTPQPAPQPEIVASPVEGVDSGGAGHPPTQQPSASPSEHGILSQAAETKLSSLASQTNLPPEIWLHVLILAWDRLDPAMQETLILEAHRVRVERLLAGQSKTLAAIERLLQGHADSNGAALPPVRDGLRPPEGLDEPAAPPR